MEGLQNVDVQKNVLSTEMHMPAFCPCHFYIPEEASAFLLRNDTAIIMASVN